MVSLLNKQLVSFFSLQTKYKYKQSKLSFAKYGEYIIFEILDCLRKTDYSFFVVYIEIKEYHDFVIASVRVISAEAKTTALLEDLCRVLYCRELS